MHACKIIHSNIVRTTTTIYKIFKDSSIQRMFLNFTFHLALVGTKHTTNTVSSLSILSVKMDIIVFSCIFYNNVFYDSLFFFCIRRKKEPHKKEEDGQIRQYNKRITLKNITLKHNIWITLRLNIEKEATKMQQKKRKQEEPERDKHGKRPILSSNPPRYYRLSIYTSDIHDVEQLYIFFQ